MLKSGMSTEECLYRGLHVSGESHCSLLAELLHCFDGDDLGAVPDAGCQKCVQHPRPDRNGFNPVFASLLLEKLSGRGSGYSLHSVESDLHRMAIESLDVADSETPGLESLVDHSFTISTLTARIERHEPTMLLRFGDGEWYSILGMSGHNCDLHSFLPDTMGRELRQILQSLSHESCDRFGIFVGTTCELSREAGPIIRHLSGPERLRWVSDAIFRLGMETLGTKQFVKACQRFSGCKVVVGSVRLRPVARALGAHHVVIPLMNCYEQIDEIQRTCEAIRPKLVLSCASMASECLLWRLWQKDASAILLDCGSIFDVMLRRPIRSEYSGWSQLIDDQYFPMFAEYCEADDLVADNPTKGERDIGC